MSQLKNISFFFLRHGQTDWNHQQRLMGKKDIPLNELGIQQAHEAAQYLKDALITQIVASPLLRARQTAEIINSYLNVPLKFHDDLQECGWGILEGKVKDVLSVEFEYWRTGFIPPGGESISFFQFRVLKAINAILQPKHTTLIVAHGGIYWALMHTLGYPDQHSDNCIPYLFRSPEQDSLPWQVSSLIHNFSL